MEECCICVENKLKVEIFTCLACKFSNCIDCHKKYLLTSVNDPHCMNCRSVIPYDIFLNKFNDKKWIFNEYKIHKSNILFSKEKSLLPETVQKIAHEKEVAQKKKELQDEISLIMKERRKLDMEISLIEEKIYALSTKKTEKVKFNYTYSCPKTGCKGFLSEEFKCGLCDSIVCKKCYTVKDGNQKENQHVCDEGMVETFNAIKKEAKPCPTCGEFISKVSGCDQIFCTKCGTAFSWKTGTIEKGIIHNPHAHEFFQKNPEARDAYLNALNGGGANAGGDGACRPPIPPYQKMYILYSVQNIDYKYIERVHRRVGEFRQYRREEALRIVAGNFGDKNEDIRERYVYNQYNDKSFKSLLHKRDKANYFRKEVIGLIMTGYEIAEIILWCMVDKIENAVKNGVATYVNNRNYGTSPTLKINSPFHKADIEVTIQKHIETLKNTSNDINVNIHSLKESFGYTGNYGIGTDFTITGNIF